MQRSKESGWVSILISRWMHWILKYLSRGEQYVYQPKGISRFCVAFLEKLSGSIRGAWWKPYLHFLLKNIVWTRTAHAANLKVKISKLENDLTGTIMSYEALRVQYLHVISVIVKRVVRYFLSLLGVIWQVWSNALFAIECRRCVYMLWYP